MRDTAEAAATWEPLVCNVISRCHDAHPFSSRQTLGKGRMPACVARAAEVQEGREVHDARRSTNNSKSHSIKEVVAQQAATECDRRQT